MGLKSYEWDYLGKIPIGQAIVNMKGDFPDSFLVKFPLVKIKAHVSDKDVKRHMEDAYFSKKSVKWPCFPKRSGFQGISKKANLSPHLEEKNKEDLLLVEILDNPFISVTQHYKNLGLNYRDGNDIKKQLQAKEYISEEQISEGIVRKKILSLTEKGRSYLRVKGWKVPERKTNAGAEHEYWKDKIKKDLIKQGAKVKEEVPV